LKEIFDGNYNRVAGLVNGYDSIRP